MKLVRPSISVSIPCSADEVELLGEGLVPWPGEASQTEADLARNKGAAQQKDGLEQLGNQSTTPPLEAAILARAGGLVPRIELRERWILLPNCSGIVSLVALGALGIQ